jgi:antirestriction protein ArdC
MSTANVHIDVYQIVTDQIIGLLEQGTVPWRKPWTTGIPCNLLSKRPYRGLNVWLLAAFAYPQPYFLTFDQIKELGGSVKRGETGHMVIFWKSKQRNGTLEETEDENPKPRRSFPILRYYKVFNVDQIKGLPADLIPKEIIREHQPIAVCEQIVSSMPDCPPIRFEKQQAFYHPLEDYINMPMPGTFETPESYYSTLFHELVHSTGHDKRLKRKSIMEMAEMGGPEYSVEELIAEIGSCYLCNTAGILPAGIANSAAYLQAWLKRLRGASQAQRATDFIINLLSLQKSELEQPPIIV